MTPQTRNANNHWYYHKRIRDTSQSTAPSQRNHKELLILNRNRSTVVHPETART